MSAYSPTKTAAKGVKYGLPLAAVTAIIAWYQGEPQELEQLITVVLVPMLLNWTFQWLLPKLRGVVAKWWTFSFFLLLAILVTGCNTTDMNLHQGLVNDLQPDVEGEVLDFRYKKVVPFWGKEKESDGSLRVKVNADGSYELIANTSQMGVDNTGQIAGMAMLGQTFVAPFQPLINAGAQAIINRNPAPMPEVAPEE